VRVTSLDELALCAHLLAHEAQAWTLPLDYYKLTKCVENTCKRVTLA